MSETRADRVPSGLDSGPFGDSAAILANRRAFHRFALDILVPSGPSIESVPFDSLDLDAVDLRIALSRLIDRHASGNALTTAVLDSIARQTSSVPATAEPQIFPELWRDPSRRDRSTPESVRTILDEATRNDLTGVRAVGELLDVTPDLRERYDRACALLLEIDPELTRAVVPHAKACLWVDVGTGDAVMESGTARTMPGVVLLSGTYLDSDFDVARGLLHEAAHCKLFDLYLTRPILPSDTDLLTNYRVQCPWNPDRDLQSNRWPVDQTLAAAHVYVHLARLDAAAPSDHRPEQSPDSAERADYLLAALSDLPASCLGVDGWDLVTWLRTSLLPGPK